MNTASVPAERSPLDRLLGLLAEVRPGEGVTAVLLALDIFLLLAAYYLLKTIREPLILAGAGGADVKSYSAAAIAALLIVLVPAYGALASRLSRVRLINAVTSFFLACLVAFFAAHGAGVAIGVPFFIWVGIFNLMVIAQLWGFANDVYTVEQGKRLFAIVGLGASTGAIVGSFAAGRLVEGLGVRPAMIGAAVLLALTMALTNVISMRSSRERAARASGAEAAVAAKAKADETLGGKSGFTLVLGDRYLLLIALLMVILNLVNTTGEYILGQTVSGIAKEMVASGRAGGLDEGRIIGGFYGSYFTWVNAISFVAQAFLVSRVIKHLGVRGALLVLPVIALVGYAALAALPLLAVIRVVKIAENSTDYSLMNTTRNTLYLPTSREAKYKAKQATDTFFVRFGDVLSAGLVYVGLHAFALAPRQFALVNVALVIVWIAIVVALGREFGRRESAAASA